MNLETTLAEFEQLAFEKEKEYWKIEARRRLRINEDRERDDKLNMYLKGAEELKRKLDEGREDWLEKLRKTAASNELEIQPFNEQTGELQIKIEKLQLKKDELERNLHPEQYAVADVPVGAALLDTEGASSRGDDSGKHSHRGDDDGAEGEDELFADDKPLLPGSNGPAVDSDQGDRTPQRGTAGAAAGGASPRADGDADSDTYTMRQAATTAPAEGAASPASTNPEDDGDGGSDENSDDPMQPAAKKAKTDRIDTGRTEQ